MDKKSNNLLIGCLASIGCEALYGASYGFTKSITESVSAISLLGWRFLVAFSAMSLCVLCGLVKVRRPWRNLRSLLPVALFCPILYFAGETFGIRLTTASESGVFIACIPAASLAASSLILRKSPTRLQMTGIAVTLTGAIVTVVSLGVSSSLSAAGYLFLLLAVCSYSLYCVFVDKASACTSAEITYAMLGAGAAVFGAMAIAEGLAHGAVAHLARLPLENMQFLAAILYLGVGCSVLAFFLANVSIARIGVNRTASFVGISTVVSVLAGVLALGEPFSRGQAIGAAVIIAGVYIANADSLRERRTANGARGR